MKVGRKSNNKLILELRNILNEECVSQLIDESKCECPICIDLAVVPVLLDCGHVYCLQCYE